MATTTQITQTIIQQRRGTAAQWTSSNPVLAEGEWGLELDTNQAKFGDGTTAWIDLPYTTDPTPTDTSTTLLGGDGPPSNDLGVVGEYYIDTSGLAVYGPKATSTAANAFPTSAAVDSFQQADGALSSKWTGPIYPSGNVPQVVSDMATGANTSDEAQSAAYWNNLQTADMDVWVTIPTFANRFDLWARIQNPQTGNISGYYLHCLPGVANNGNNSIQLNVVVNGGPTTLGTSTVALANGDSLGLRVYGTQIVAYHKTASGAWTPIINVTNSVISGPGYGGFGVYDYNPSTAISAFAVGAVATSVEPAWPASSTPLSSAISVDTVVQPSGDTTGTTDTANVNAALSVGNVKFVSNNGDPFYLKSVSVTGKSRRIYCDSPVTIYQCSQSNVFSLYGGWDNLGTVSSYATTSEKLAEPSQQSAFPQTTPVTVLTLAAAQSVTVGDVVKIISDDLMPMSRQSLPVRQGEYSMVAQSTTGTTVELSNVLVDNYATNVRLFRAQQVRFIIEGPFTFDVTSAITGDTSNSASPPNCVINIMAATNCVVRGCTFQNSAGMAIGNYSYCTTIEDCFFYGLQNRPSTYIQYGYGVQNGGWQMTMRNCHSRFVRHMYSEGNGGPPPNGPEPANYGGGWFALVSNCTGFANQAQTFDTHGSSYGNIFDSCEAYGDFIGASSGGTGFSVRGRRHVIQNCVVDNCYSGIAITAAGCSVRNCEVRNAQWEPLVVAQDNSDALSSETNYVTGFPGAGPIEIEGGFYESVDSAVGDNGVFIISSLSNTTVMEVRMRNVSLKQSNVNPTQSPSGIILYGTTTLIVENVRFDASAVIGSADASITGINIGDSNARLIVRGFTMMLGNAQASTNAKLTGAQNVGTSGQNAFIDAEGLVWEGIVFPAFMDGTQPGSYAIYSNAKVSWRARMYSPSGVTSYRSSGDLTLNVAAGGSFTAPVLQSKDPVINITLTGAPASAATITLPTGSPYPLPGQKVVFWNATTGSNTTVTMPVGTLATGAGAVYTWMNDAWRNVG